MLIKPSLMADTVTSDTGVPLLKINKVSIHPNTVNRPYNAIQAQLGCIVDKECAKLKPMQKGGTFFGSPSPTAAIVTENADGSDCRSVTCVEVLSSYDSWKRRISEYMTLYNHNQVLEIESAWTCSSSSKWYGSIPGLKSRGASMTGFLRTKPLLEDEKLVPLAEFVITMNGVRGSAMKIASAVLNWDTSKWATMESQFLHDSKIHELLSEIATNNDRVPMRLQAGSFAVVVRASDNVPLRCVLLPTLPSTIYRRNITGAANMEWVNNTMRDVWIEIASDMSTVPGITEYKPSSAITKAMKIFMVGALGATTLTFGLGALSALFNKVKSAIVTEAVPVSVVQLKAK